MTGSIPASGTPEEGDGPHHSAQSSQTQNEKGQDSDPEKNSSVDTAIAPEPDSGVATKAVEAEEPEQEDKKPDYSSQSQNKVSFSHYLVWKHLYPDLVITG